MPSPLMSVPEVAEYLRTTPKGVYCMIARGLLPVTRIGRRVLIRRDVLERALDEKTVTSPFKKGDA
jgi:excisionase family DNA binding protein